jgi:hypothetical protein
MNKDILPTELARRWGNLQFVKYHGNGEYSAECPQCSDSGHSGRDWPDRFRMWESPARGWCRKCFYQAFADDDKPNAHISDEQRNKWVEERLQREQEAKAQIERRIAALEREQLWLKYHDGLTSDAMKWWNRKGVPDYMVSALFLGWCQSKTFWSGDKEFDTPSATMPVFAPGWKIRTIRHRLINPIDAGDKYRPDRAGLPASLYLTNPEEAPSGECILVEGEIKSIVVYDRLDSYKLTVAGTPGKSFKPGLLNELGGCDRIWIVFDPDARLQAWKAAAALGGKRVRVVVPPCKPDDFFTLYGGTKAEFRHMLRYGRLA